MPVIFQEEINNDTRLGVWKIEEEEAFFKEKVPLHRQVTHPHKRLQHLAGRFLLQHLYPGFPYHLIKIADTKKPFLPDDAFHFSISHCGDYAAAIVSKNHRVGIDIEIPTEKIWAIQNKFQSLQEIEILHPVSTVDLTAIWSAKEAVFKWYGLGKVDFKEHIQLLSYNALLSYFECYFMLNNTSCQVHASQFSGICLSYVSTHIQQ